MLIIISSGFPFGGEPFLEGEQHFLPKDAIFFALKPGKKSKHAETVQDAYAIGNRWLIPRTVGYSLLSLFRPAFWREVWRLRKLHKLSLYCFFRALSFDAFGRLCSREILRILRGRMGEQKPPMVIYSYWMSSCAYVAGRLQKEFPKAKLITRCHGFDVYEDRAPHAYLPFRATILRQEDLICPISEYGRAYLAKREGGVEEKLELHRLGTLDRGLAPRLSEKGSMALVSCSLLTPVKRLPLLVEALSLCKSSLHWIHFGGGSSLEALKDLCRTKLADSPVSFELKGQIPNSEILAFYRENEIGAFINVSESEGIPVSIMEAISFGIPVLATAVGGTPEIVLDRENGRLLPKDLSAQGLAEAIDCFFALSEEQRQDYGRKAREIWEDRYNGERNYRDFSRRLKEIEQGS